MFKKEIFGKTNIKSSKKEGENIGFSFYYFDFNNFVYNIKNRSRGKKI